MAQDEGALGKSLERSQQFLMLSALLAVAAIAVAKCHYCRSRYDLVAILKTLGAGRAALRKLIIGHWLMVLLLSAIAGGLLFEAALPPASLGYRGDGHDLGAGGAIPSVLAPAGEPEGES